MKRGLRVLSVALLILPAVALAQERAGIDELLTRYCADCHAGTRPKAGIDVTTLGGELDQGAIETWSLVLEQLDLRHMPPADEVQPTSAERGAMIDWINALLAGAGAAPDPERLALPRFGNRVPHEELFSGEHTGPASTYPRLWRTSPFVYDQFTRDHHLYKRATQPLTPVHGHGFQDYDSLGIDDAALGSLLRNSKKVARMLLHGRDEKRPRARYREFQRVLDAEAPTDEGLLEAITRGFDALLGRTPGEEEATRYLAFVRDNIERGGVELGLESGLRAMMLSQEFLFRAELGLGAELPDGRRMLGPRELTYALSYAITDRAPDQELRRAAAEGRLETPEDAEREARRLLAVPDDKRYWTYPMYHRWGDQKAHNPRLLRFFQEYFGYERARDVFKDQDRNPTHSPKYLVRDADILVLWILEQDQDVFERLIAGDDFFVTYFSEERARGIFERNETNREKRHLDAIARYEKEQLEGGPGVDERGRPRRAMKDPGPFVPRHFDEERAHQQLPVPDGYARGYMNAYDLDWREGGWELDQPMGLPNRRGMLTHPAWLVAHSHNTENDPVRRGKWILERLLGRSVPDVPIGVDAKVEEDPHRTLRERFAKVEVAECWRCHQHMNPLGMPFEAYDDFGRHRDRFFVDAEGELQEWGRLDERDREEKVRTGEWTTRPVDTTGHLAGTGNPALDGAVDDPLDLVQRLAASDRARQVFLRHVFRFWMGRNETLDDSPTLIAMERTYLETGGSFRETLVTLLTSDSFLTRKEPSQ